MVSRSSIHIYWRKLQQLLWSVQACRMQVDRNWAIHQPVCNRPIAGPVNTYHTLPLHCDVMNYAPLQYTFFCQLKERPPDLTTSST
jgi:hypothetical protein